MNTRNDWAHMTVLRPNSGPYKAAEGTVYLHDSVTENDFMEIHDLLILISATLKPGSVEEALDIISYFSKELLKESTEETYKEIKIALLDTLTALNIPSDFMDEEFGFFHNNIPDSSSVRH